MSAYSVITLDSHDLDNKSIHPDNHTNNFRVDIPTIHYPLHAECALTKLVYHHEFHNIHQFNRIFFIKISLPITVWVQLDTIENDQFLDYFDEGLRNVDWPVDGDPFLIESWERVPYDPENHERFWHSQIYECHLTVGNHRSPKTLMNTIVSEARSRPGSLLGVPHVVLEASERLFGAPPIVAQSTAPSLGLKVTGNTALFLHSNICQLMNLDDRPSTPAEHDPSFVNYIETYTSQKPHISKYRVFNYASMARMTIPANMQRRMIQYKITEATNNLSKGELYLEVSTDIVKSNHVLNNKLTRILYTTRCEKTFGSIVQIEPFNLIFLPCIGAHFGNIGINIRAYSLGEPVLLQGPASVTLRLQGQIFTANQQ